MADKYFLEYRNRIEKNVGRSDADSQQKIVDAFNLAMTSIATHTSVKSLQDTITTYFEKDNYIYSFDSLDIPDAQHIYTITLNDGSRYYPPLIYVSKNVYDQEIKPFIHSLRGKPHTFTVYDNTLYVAGVPDSSEYYVDISLSYWPTPVIDDFSLVSMTDCDAALEALATALFWLKIEEIKLYSIWLTEARRELKAYSTDRSNVVVFPGKYAARNSSSGFTRSPDYWLDPFRRSI